MGGLADGDPEYSAPASFPNDLWFSLLAECHKPVLFHSVVWGWDSGPGQELGKVEQI